MSKSDWKKDGGAEGEEPRYRDPTLTAWRIEQGLDPIPGSDQEGSDPWSRYGRTFIEDRLTSEEAALFDFSGYYSEETLAIGEEAYTRKIKRSGRSESEVIAEFRRLGQIPEGWLGYTGY